jgi:hypothetical protein
MRQKRFTPPRFDTCTLYHETRACGIRTSKLANSLMGASLKDSPGVEAGRRSDAIGGGQNRIPDEVNDTERYVTGAQSSRIEPASFSAFHPTPEQN